MTAPVVIGFSGKAGVGKDTYKDSVLRLTNYKYVPYSFAGPLKKACEFMFGWSQDQIEDRKFKEAIDPAWGFSPRRAMQLLGTEFGRVLKPTLWLDFATKKLQEVQAYDFAGLVVPDVRFENEAKWVRDLGGILVHLEASDLKTDVPAHASESGVARVDGDVVIVNHFDGIRSVDMQVRSLLNTYGIPVGANYGS